MPDEPVLKKSWVIRNRLGEEKPVISGIARLLEEARLPESKKEDIVTSIAEGVINAIEHGNRLKEEASVQIKMEVYSDRYLFRIYDEGGGFAVPRRRLNRRSRRNNETARGWGLYLISSLSDSLEVGRDETGFYTQIRFDMLNN